jgi:hypothetical protein
LVLTNGAIELKGVSVRAGNHGAELVLAAFFMPGIQEAAVSGPVLSPGAGHLFPPIPD